MRTIVYIIPALIKSGPVNVLYNTIKYLDRTKFNPVVVALYKHNLRHRDNTHEFVKLGIEVITYEYSKFNLYFSAKKIAKNIQLQFDKTTIFHAHGYFPTIIVSKMKNVSTITTIHNRCDEDYMNTYGKLMGYYMSYTFKKALNDISICVPICDSMKKYYSSNPKLELSVVYNGVNVNNTIIKKDQAKEKLGINNKIVLIYPAAFNKRKNHAVIIQELKKSNRQDFVVLFPGMGTEEDYCKSLAGDDIRFRFVGYQMDMELYWAASDFLISSSLSEGLPMAVLEALIKGIPCILSNIAPHKELINKVFDNVELCFDPNTAGNLKEIFEQTLLLEFDNQQIKEKAINLYSSKVMSENYDRLYSRI